MTRRWLTRVFGSIRRCCYCLIVVTFTVSGCESVSESGDAEDQATFQVALPPGFSGEATPWTTLNALDGDARFHFAIVTDRTGGERPGIFGPAMETVNLMQPAFVLSVGDLIQGYTTDRAQISAEWDELDRFVAELDAPFFFTPGNHDYANEVMADIWAERYGPSYYSFRYKDVLFIVLNSALFDRDGVQGHGERRGDWASEQREQLRWLQSTLDASGDVRWTFLLMHRPYWRSSWVDNSERDTSAVGPWPKHATPVAEWEDIEQMLADRDYTAFAGHMHSYDYETDHGSPHSHDRIALATTGGVSSMRGVAYGEFDHIVWLTMTEDGPVIANLLLDGVLPKDFEQRFQRPWFAPRDPNDPDASHGEMNP